MSEYVECVKSYALFEIGKKITGKDSCDQQDVRIGFYFWARNKP